MTATNEVLLRAAFDKLVEVSQEQIQLSTQQVEALRGINERLDRVALEHREASRATREHVDGVITSRLAQSEIWWRRAFMAFGVLVVLGAIVGAALDRLLPLVKP